MRLNWRHRRVDQRLLPRVMLLSRPGLFKSRLVLRDLLGWGTLDQVLAQATKEKVYESCEHNGTSPSTRSRNTAIAVDLP